jgi:membrane fusion protein, copper/silver efflux system
MKPTRLASYIIIAIAAFAAGLWFNQRLASTSNTESQKQNILRYSCPMHPQYISDRPGDCPSCGMRLVPVNGSKDGVEDRTKDSNSGLLTGTIHISPEKLQIIGVRMARVERAPFERRLRILGQVAVDETRIYRLNASVNGWIRKTYPNSKGSLIKKDETLAAFYSPEFLSAEQALLYSLGALDRWESSDKETPEQIALTKANIQQAVDSLRNLGMGDIQVEEIKRARQLTQDIEVRSPAAGFILERNVSAGQRFEQGTELYRIADLSHIWIQADMFENEVHYFKPGANATVIHAAQKIKLNAKVSNVLPQFDPATRTLKVRLEVENPNFILRPDMFVDVEYPISLPATLTVPAEAILDTGLRKTVFVDIGDGYFEPRRIETGWRMADRVEVVKGLMEGEHIVISGNFLIDSESRMREAAMGMRKGSVEDPICGMQVDPIKAGDKKTTYKGETYYFCSEMCKKSFQENPEKYVHSNSKTMSQNNHMNRMSE